MRRSKPVISALFLSLGSNLTLFMRSALRSRTALVAENLFLRKQLAFYREHKARPRPLTDAARLSLVFWSRLFEWKDALVIVKPETLIGWHRKGFKLFWRWKSRPGRPPLPREIRELIARRVKASAGEIARSLEGNWREDLLFLLQQEQDSYEFCQKQMSECDERLQHFLQRREDRSAGASLPEEKRKERLKKKKTNKPRFDLRAELFRMTGTDLTQIDGIDVRTAATVISEAGWNMSKWRTEDHFVSWLRLCPDNRVSGDKIIGKGRLPITNRLTVAPRIAATTLRPSRTYLGAQFRRLKTRLGAPIAIKAMAAKLARLVY